MEKYEQRFESVYNRYFELEELEQLLASFGFRVKHSYFGDVFLAVVAEN